MAFSTGLSKAETERLALLSEELGEAQAMIGKILRHGYSSYNPFDDDHVTNRRLLERELGDVLCAIDMMNAAGDIDQRDINEAKTDKALNVMRWLHYQKPERDPARQDWLERLGAEE